MPTEIASTVDLDQVLATNRKVVVGFYASWSEPCKIIFPTFDGFEPEFPDLLFVKVNVDSVPEIKESTLNKAPDVPAFVAYLNSRDFAMIHGTNADNLKELLDGLNSAEDDD